MGIDLLKKQIFLPEQQIDEINKIAEKDGRTFAEHVRESLQRYIETKTQEINNEDNDSL